jgi:plasmid stabilization system protein ParE
MKPVRFHSAAQIEAIEAAVPYERQRTGLGLRFIDALSNTVSRIQTNPFLYRVVEEEARKCRVLRFPYGVIFRPAIGDIEVVAVMHLRREPGYWKSRMEGES